MADEPKPVAMDDIIGKTLSRRKPDEGKGALPDLKSLVGNIAVETQPPPSRIANTEQLKPSAPGYFPQQADYPDRRIVKKRPKRGETRTEHISLRMAPGERDRFYQWCNERDISTPDAIMLLMDIAEGKVTG